MHLAQNIAAVALNLAQRVATGGQAGLDVLCARWRFKARDALAPKKLELRRVRMVLFIEKGNHVASIFKYVESSSGN